MALEVYNGAAWMPIHTIEVYDGAAWQTVTAGWVYDGTTWQQWKSGFGFSACSWAKTAGSCSGGPPSGTCIQEVHRVSWTVVGCVPATHHIDVWQNINGAGYTFKGTNNCSGSYMDITNAHWYLKPAGHQDRYQYKVELQLDSDHSILDTCETSNDCSNFHENCTECTGA